MRNFTRHFRADANDCRTGRHTGYLAGPGPRRREGEVHSGGNGCRPALALLVLAAATMTGPQQVQAEAGASNWVRGNLSQVRLIAGKFDGKTWQAGVEIRLKGRAHTYWRNPGDGGVPPVFDFSKSANVAGAKALFPAPSRSGKPGEEIIGYEHAVVFPVQVTPASPAAPVKLNLHLNYAACEKICVPEQAKLSLTLKPSTPVPATAQLIDAYVARLPKPLATPGAPKLHVANKAPEKTWTFRIEGVTKGPSDLFIEGQEGWYFDRKVVSKHEIELTLAQKPENAASIPPVRVTLTTGKGAFEGTKTLP
jgi:DsbC/DsbD-like thiol-disulfide interchange protein